jgi:hypothetical protein
MRLLGNRANGTAAPKAEESDDIPPFVPVN